MTTSQSVFKDTYEAVKKEIPFDYAWYNGTGYLDHAVTADLGLSAGQLAKSEHTADTGATRRAIIVGTPLGNAVFFERYHTSPTDTERCATIVSNCPEGVRQFVKPGSIDPHSLFEYINVMEIFNIGGKIQNVVRAWNALQKNK